MKKFLGKVLVLSLMITCLGLTPSYAVSHGNPAPAVGGTKLMPDSFVGKRVVKQYQMHVSGSPEQVFPLLCPVKENLWIPYAAWGAVCSVIYSDSGVAEEGCVFLTNFPNEGRVTWVVSRYEAPNVIQFVKVYGDKATLKWDLEVKGNPDNTSTIYVTYNMTGLNEEGNRYVDVYVESSAAKIKGLEKLLNYYLVNGKMLEQ